MRTKSVLAVAMVAVALGLVGYGYCQEAKTHKTVYLSAKAPTHAADLLPAGWKSVGKMEFEEQKSSVVIARGPKGEEAVFALYDGMDEKSVMADLSSGMIGAGGFAEKDGTYRKSERGLKAVARIGRLPVAGDRIAMYVARGVATTEADADALCLAAVKAVEKK